MIGGHLKKEDFWREDWISLVDVVSDVALERHNLTMENEELI